MDYIKIYIIKFIINMGLSKEYRDYTLVGILERDNSPVLCVNLLVGNDPLDMKWVDNTYDVGWYLIRKRKLFKMFRNIKRISVSYSIQKDHECIRLVRLDYNIPKFYDMSCESKASVYAAADSQFYYWGSDYNYLNIYINEKKSNTRDV